MNRAMHLWRGVLCAVVILAGSAGLWAQSKSAVASRVVQAVDDTVTITLKGNVHPLASAANDQGPLPDSQPMTRMLLLLQRSLSQEVALKQLIDAQQTKGSGSYHAWLTTQQFGNQFGPSDADVQAVTDWLTRQGFQVAKVAAGKTSIEFDGTAGQVRTAFHTEVHKFAVNGEVHFANVSDPSIPEALSPVVAGVVALHNFPKYPNVRRNGIYRRTKGSNQLEPLFTYGNPANYAVGPGDFAKIYNIPATATGAGQSIAVIAQTNINTQDVVNFRAMFGLPAYSSVCTSALPPTCQFSVIVNGVDPGIVGPDSATDDEIEADLDSQWAGAVAPGANIYLIVSQTTISNPSQISQGVDLSALYAVDNNIAPIISDSYASCEAALLTAGNQFYNSLWAQAAAQGISVAVAAGDSGPAACDPIFSLDPYAATQGVAVNGLASTPYNVAVGGTDFDPSTTGNATYWTANSSGDVVNSALGYIPETTWDNSACALAYPAACTTVDTSGYNADISAGSGGPSNCIAGTANNSTGVITCAKTNGLYGYAKPSFQTSLTPADSVRDLPDVSFFASNGGPITGGSNVAYVICQSDTNPQGSTTPTGAACSINTPYTNFSLVGGTSAATPAFAAVMALVNAATGQQQGNPNYVLYSLAANDANYVGGKCTSSLGQTPAAGCVFNDVTKGNNSVACDADTANCSNTANTSGTYGVLLCTPASSSVTPVWQTCPTADNGTPAFVSVARYDLATGLGSINVGNLLTKWTAAPRTATTTTVTSPSGGSPTGTAFTAKVTVAPAAATGNVSLIALDGSTPPNVLGTIGTNSSGNLFSISGGTATITTNVLPVDTVAVEATYGGNATYAVSTSAPVALSGKVTGAGNTAKTTISAVGATGTVTTSAQNFPYGTPYSLVIVVSRSDGTSCAFGYPSTKPNSPTIPCPTGTITLTDNGNPLNDFLNNGTATNVAKLNNLGIVEDQPINLSATVGSTTPGAHNLVATYSGDLNYAAGPASNTMQITIQQVSTTTQVSTSLSSITSGQSVLLAAVITPTAFSNGNAPCGGSSTGTVQFTNNGSVLPGTVTYTAVPGQTNANGAACSATLTAAISALYPPPTTSPGTPSVPRIPLLVAFLSLLLFALGLRWTPRAHRRAYAGLLAIALLVGVIAGCGGGGSNNSGGTTRTIGASYSGDANYTKSAGTTTITIQ
jgi:Pro-kumamolisin, activation domain